MRLSNSQLLRLFSCSYIRVNKGIKLKNLHFGGKIEGKTEIPALFGQNEKQPKRTV